MIGDKNWVVLINPVAGKGNGEKNWPAIAKLLTKNNISFRFFFTRFKGHIKEIIQQQLQNGNHNFLICGGDGSLNEAVNASMNSSENLRQEIVLGVIPIGSGNDWSLTHSISTNCSDAVKQFANGIITNHDVGFAFPEHTLEKYYFINIAGVGYDGHVVKKINDTYPEIKPGKIIYLFTLLKELLFYKNQLAKIKSDKFILKEKMFSMSIAICKYNGGGMMQAPQAIYNDGLLTVNIIKNLSKWEVLLNLGGLKDGSYVNHKKVISLNTQKLSISAKEILSEADGEFIGNSNIEFGIEPLALKVVLPQHK